MPDHEERIELLTRATGQGVWEIDFAAGRVWCNSIYQNRFGPVPEKPGDFPDWWLERLHPEDRQAAAAGLEAALAGQADRWACAYRFLSRDGSHAALLDQASIARDAAGAARRITGTVTGAADLAMWDAEELGAILDAAPAALLVTRDPAARLVLGNRTAYEMLRLPRGANLGGLPRAGEGKPAWTAEKDGLALAAADLPVQTAARTGVPLRDYEFDLIHADGRRRHMLAGAVPLLSASGTPRGAVGAYLDITERKHFENHARDAERTDRIGVLAGGLAHQFNNLLLGVMGNASLAQDLLPPGHPVADLLKGVLESSEGAADLVRQMLAYSGKGRFVMERMDLSEVAGKAVARSLPSSTGVKIALKLAADLPPLEGDPGQLQQLVAGLVVNAVEAIGCSEGSITVSTGVRDVAAPFHPGPAGGAWRPAGRYVFLEVSDTGCGMDQATQSRIFDPFFTTKFTGRGLGLSAAAGIVRGHKGAIAVTSTAGQGTSFVVLLPAVEPLPRTVEQPAEDLRGTGTVLLVDDEEMVRDVARRSLEWWGYQVLVAGSGPEAIEMFRAQDGRICAVVLDLTMPGMSGYEALLKLRQIKPDVPVLICSGHAEAAAMRVFADNPPAGFLHKPYTSRQLARQVKTICGREPGGGPTAF